MAGLAPAASILLLSSQRTKSQDPQFKKLCGQCGKPIEAGQYFCSRRVRIDNELVDIDVHLSHGIDEHFRRRIAEQQEK